MSLVILAYDGSEPARAAVREAARVLAPRKALVVTIWEPALANAALMPSIAPGVEMAPDLGAAAEIERKAEDHAAALASEGVQLASSVGFEAESLVVPDEVNVPETIAHVAAERGADVVAVGSRGLTGLKAALLGSTSQGLLQRCKMPVLVVRGSPPEA
jgi:nucleotide-binding universal stress UspA family protein